LSSIPARTGGASILCCCFALPAPLQSLVAGDDFQHILRVLNTNVDGKQKIMYAMTAIRGIGRRFSNLVCKKGEVDMSKR
jgi:Ribosomal protein S13/S18